MSTAYAAPRTHGVRARVNFQEQKLYGQILLREAADALAPVALPGGLLGSRAVGRAMTMITLFYAPGSCSRVPLICLGEIGTPFETRLIRFVGREHKSPDYRRFNPKGKVPAIVVDGEALTENVAILTYLAAIFPAASILPETTSAMEQARQLADLCFCSATLHPLVTRVRMPQLIGPPGASLAIYDVACAAIREPFALIEARLADGAWWYGTSGAR